MRWTMGTFKVILYIMGCMEMNVDTMDTMAWICWEKCTQQKSWHFYHQNVLGFPISFFPSKNLRDTGEIISSAEMGTGRSLSFSEFRKAWIQGSFFHPGGSSPKAAPSGDGAAQNLQDLTC